LDFVKDRVEGDDLTDVACIILSKQTKPHINELVIKAQSQAEFIGELDKLVKGISAEMGG